MRPTQRALLLSTLLVASSSAGAAVDSAPDSAVLRLQVVTDRGNVDGTGVLIHREDHGTDVVLYFVTSARLFKDPEGGLPLRTQVTRVRLDGHHTLDVPRDSIFVCPGVIDVAVLRATSPMTALVPRPVIYEEPSPGEVFHITGYGPDLQPATIAERVRFRSTIFAVGDRDASALLGCVGAPAISRSGAFGVVSECAPGRTPKITLFSVARPFIERHAPISRPSNTAQHHSRIVK
jgi:hypothetical protein